MVTKGVFQCKGFLQLTIKVTGKSLLAFQKPNVTDPSINFFIEDEWGQVAPLSISKKNIQLKYPPNLIFLSLEAKQTVSIPFEPFEALLGVLPKEILKSKK